MLKRILCAVLLGVFMVGPGVAPQQHVLKAQSFESTCSCSDGPPQYEVPGGHIEGFYQDGTSDHLTNLYVVGQVSGNSTEELKSKCKSSCDAWLGAWNAQACSVHGFSRTIRWGKYFVYQVGTFDLTTVDSSC
jgi:hypothetical protein